MTAEQITTIITNLLTGGGVAMFFFFVVRSLKKEINGLNKTIEQQNKTLDVMEKRIIETEKIGNIYRDLIDDLPEHVAKYKKFITESKDDVIAQLQNAQDETVRESRQVELKRLEVQEKMINELPQLLDQFRGVFTAIQDRLDAMQQGGWNPLDQPNFLIFGAPGTGKTRLLSSLVFADAPFYSSEEIKQMKEYHRKAVILNGIDEAKDESNE